MARKCKTVRAEPLAHQVLKGRGPLWSAAASAFTYSKAIDAALKSFGVKAACSIHRIEGVHKLILITPAKGLSCTVL